LQLLAAKELRSAGGANDERHREVPTKLKLLMQTIAGRFGYFIIKKERWTSSMQHDPHSASQYLDQKVMDDRMN
jgi:hypothetical protein